MGWDWAFVESFLPQLWQGVIVTVYATALGSVLATTLGLAFAIARRSRVAAVSGTVTALLDFVRGTPLLVQLYFVFFVLPDIGLLLPPLACGVMVLGLHYSTYTAEVYRAGIDNVPTGQWEAAKACNMTLPQTWLHVILPQAVPPMIPPLANYFIAMFKETPLLSAITVVELMTQARSVANFTYRYLEPMTMVGLFFLAISIPAAIALRRLELRFGSNALAQR